MLLKISSNAKREMCYHDVYFENGWKYEKAKYKTLENWLDKTKEFIVTTL